jgi:hypothetical protein
MTKRRSTWRELREAVRLLGCLPAVIFGLAIGLLMSLMFVLNPSGPGSTLSGGGLILQVLQYTLLIGAPLCLIAWVWIIIRRNYR